MKDLHVTDEGTNLGKRLTRKKSRDGEEEEDSMQVMKLIYKETLCQIAEYIQEIEFYCV
ncbi:uncharacterized protein G2W53_039102 [Senna tora]|uniref:Uncharacterized protein n=1 Tax=Senna tora TaxID=362788 RepID=A0A834SNS6_9FABA|nr:uncharacterized protein G2W53_039102 [Senna tora]